MTVMRVFFKLAFTDKSVNYECLVISVDQFVVAIFICN